jgi:MFS family permease
VIEKLLPYWSNRTVRYYYLTEVFINFWVIAPVWFFVFRHFVSVREIGINEIIVFTIGFLAEIPSGALADTFGRKKILVLGGIMLAFGSLATALSNDILPLIAAQSLWFIGYAFYSGANEALAYDELIDAGIEDKWQLISARAKNLVVIVIIASVLLGGVLYSINYRLPFYAHALAMVAFTLCASRYPIEKTKHALGEHSFRAYLKGIKIGTTDLLRPRLRFLVYGVGGFASLYYAYEWGVLRPLILSYRGYEGFSASMLSFVVHCVLFGLYLVVARTVIPICRVLS